MKGVWKDFAKTYKIQEVLGFGGYGGVYLVRDRKTGDKYALKVYTDDNLKIAKSERLREATLLQEANGRCGIPLMYDTFMLASNPQRNSKRQFRISKRGPPCPALLMDYVEGQDLSEWRRDNPPTEAQVIDITTQLSRSLACLHAIGIAHRDVKLPNIIIDPQGNIRLVDVGISCTIGNPESSPLVQCKNAELIGSFDILPPEALLDGMVGYPVETYFAADIWAIGTIAYDLLASDFLIQSAFDFFPAYPYKTPLPLPAYKQRLDNLEISAEFKSVLRRMLHKDPAKRPTAIEAVEQLERLHGSIKTQT